MNKDIKKIIKEEKKKLIRYDNRTLIQKIFGHCDCPCHRRHWLIYPKTFRMRTMYQEEASNYITCCKEFYESEIASYWDEMWEDYYASRL